jgi:hypothetical protein
MTTATASTIEALEAHGAALTALAGNLRSASAIQWEAAPRRVPSVDGVRLGGIADPTPRTAGDEQRLRVRFAILLAESALASSADALTSASSALVDAVDAWTGD